MDSMTLFTAMSYLEDTDILEAGAIMEGTGKTQSLPRLKARRALLIAAVIAALALTACTAAAVFLGLEKRLIPAETPVSPLSTSANPAAEAPGTGGYLSGYGLADTPEALASLEWVLYYEAHEEERVGEAWFSADEQEAWQQRVYAAFDREALDKLYEIAGKYGLALHTSSTSPLNNEDLYLVAGTGPFFLADGGSGRMGAWNIYENGAFTAAGEIRLADSVSCSFRLERNGPGVLIPPSSLYISDPEAYEQWQFTTAAGDTLTAARRENPDDLLYAYAAETAFVFCEKDGWSATLRLDFPAPGGKEAVEAAAACFDFAALCSGGDKVQSFIDAGPTVSTTGQAISVADFMATPEYKAAAAFDEQYAAYLTERYAEDSIFQDSAFNFNSYYGGWPSGDPALDALAEALWTEYGLSPASSGVVLSGWELYEADQIWPNGAIAPQYFRQAQAVSTEEIYALLGCEPFASNAEPFRGPIYDNGGFCVNFPVGGFSADVHYIPKGSFYTALALYPSLPASADMSSWVYDTAWGGSVTIALDTSNGIHSQAFILYETDSAYVAITCGKHEARILEGIIDGMDLSKLR